MSKRLCTRRTTCRLCESPELDLALPIRPTPIADAYVPERLVHIAQPLFPLDLYLCRKCGHAQVLDVIDPEYLFREYIYSTSISLGLVQHFAHYADDVVANFLLQPGQLAVDIGSNDGTLLSFLKARGLRVLGFDPATTIANAASAKGIPTVATFFDRRSAAAALNEHGAATLITANNVFAHADDLAEMAAAIELLLAPDGIFVFEVSYIGDIIERSLFDTIYHEHLCYHALAPLVTFFQLHGLELFDVQRIPNKGGSIRGYVQKTGAKRTTTIGLKAMLQTEAERGWTQLPVFREFAAKIAATKKELHAMLRELKTQGRVIAGFGASATVTTLLYNLELGEYIDFLVDDNAARHGLFSPGYHLAVRPPSDLYTRKADVVLIAAWQYAAPIAKRHAGFAEHGGRFLVPLPKPTWLTPTPTAVAT